MPFSACRLGRYLILRSSRRPSFEPYCGFARCLPPDDLVICVNTGDDETFHGLHVSPDLDTIMYTLAGLSNQETGWGLAGDTFTALEMLRRFGVDTWFNLGDRDLATHIRRTQLLSDGKSLSEVTTELNESLGVAHLVANSGCTRDR